MLSRDFHYHLPEDLIAQAPLPERTGSRLLEVDGSDGRIIDRQFSEFPQLIKAGDLLVFNDTRVVRARLFANKETGGAVELLLERVLNSASAAGSSAMALMMGEQVERGLFHARASKSLKVGQRLLLDGGGMAIVAAKLGGLIELEFTVPILPYLEKHGHVPLPPYIKREKGNFPLGEEKPPVKDDAADIERYQTVFARVDGAVAAPTAGLHFDQAMLDTLKSAGIESARVTLHVGAGTFQPVRAENIEEHRMHSERVDVSEETCAAIEAARKRGGRVVAIGTTVVRSLESAARDGQLKPLRGETDIFIRPGVPFHVVDAMLTNFHLPESTLLMLVCAFAGMNTTMAAYRHAVNEKYRFFSYGDAMFVTPAAGVR